MLNFNRILPNYYQAKFVVFPYHTFMKEQMPEIIQRYKRLDNLMAFGLTSLREGKQRPLGDNIDYVSAHLFFSDFRVNANSILKECDLFDSIEALVLFRKVHDGQVHYSNYGDYFNLRREYRHRGIKLTDENKFRRRIVASIEYSFESKTRTEEDVTDEGYPYYPIIGEARYDVVIPTQPDPSGVLEPARGSFTRIYKYRKEAQRFSFEKFLDGEQLEVLHKYISDGISRTMEHDKEVEKYIRQCRRTFRNLK